MDTSERGEPGRKGDMGRTGDTGRTGDAGDSGRGPRGYQGEPGEPGVTSTLTIPQLDEYVRRLESRYRKISRLLMAGLITMAFVFAIAGLLAIGEFRDRVRDQQTDRRDAITELCVARNERGEELIAFLGEVAPENLELGRESFPATNCADTVRRLAPLR